jgi:signal transduction histidine kinase
MVYHRNNRIAQSAANSAFTGGALDDHAVYFAEYICNAFCLLTIPEAAKFMSPGRSLFGMSFMVLITGISAYWVAGMALRPVREISQAAYSIHADTLDTRLYVAGPKDELKELAESFNAMLYRLQRAFEQQGRFVANAAHELRTPLTTLRTNLEVVCADPEASLEDYRAMASTLERQMTRLERLVVDLLLLTVERRSLNSEEVGSQLTYPQIPEALIYHAHTPFRERSTENKQ